MVTEAPGGFFSRGLRLSSESQALLSRSSDSPRADGGFSASTARNAVVSLLVLATQGTPAQGAAQRLAEEQAVQVSLRRGFENLSPADRETLQSLIGNSLSELLSLGAEQDAQLFYSGLQHCAERAQRNRNVAWVVRAFEAMVGGEGAFASIPAASRNRAREEVEVLQGGGSFGRRFEHTATHFIQEASDPGMILGMGVAGMAFSAVRLGVLARFATRPASWMTRGFGARALASGIAFPAEVLGFWGTGRAVTAVLHPERQRWDGETLRHEFASQILTLGLLKLSGAATSGLFDRFHGISALRGQAASLPAFTSFSRQAFHQLGMFGGIAAGHYVETSLGFRPDNGHLLSDSLVTLFHFNVGGRIANTVLGRGHAARISEMESRTQSFSRPAMPRWTGFGHGGLGEFALTSEGLRMPVPSKEGPLRPTILMMSSQDSGNRGGGPRIQSPTPEQPNPWNVQGTFKSVLRTMLEGDLPIGESYRMSQLLYGDLEVARREYDRLYRTDLDSGRGRPQHMAWRNLDVFLHSINRRHFETLSEGLFEWHDRFRFLQDELLKELNFGGQKQRRNVRRLIDSVDLKYLETRRYLNDAESYLGDDKGFGDGSRSKSVFAAPNYGRLIQRFLDINTRLERYIQSKPDLERLFKTYRPNPIERRPQSVAFEALDADIRANDFSPEVDRMLRAALSRDDYFLTNQENVPLQRMLRRWQAEPEHRVSEQGRRILERYLNQVDELHRGLDEAGQQNWADAHEHIAGDRFRTESFRRELGRILETSQENPDSAVNGYFDVAERLQKILGDHCPQPRNPVAPEWAQLRHQLQRLRDRGFLGVDTVAGLLRWFEPESMGRSTQAVVNMRQDAVSGLIDFVRKGSHSDEVRREISQFLGEVVGRRDLGMLGILAIYFQNYQLGMMRDRIRVRTQPSPDALGDQLAVEAYDRFLEAMRSTARFYTAHREVRGPYFEVFLKVEAGKDDNNALLAAPVVHQTQRLFDEGFRQVELLGRGGSGEAVIFARHPQGERRTITVSSVLDPLASRDHLEQWLDRAERELLHNGDYQRRQNGKERLILVLQIPKIRSGVSKREQIQTWARDYLEEHSNLAEIHLVVPEKGNSVLNPLDATFFQVQRVTRDMPTTEASIEARVRELENPGSPWTAYSGVIQLRRDWARYLTSRDPELEAILRFPDGVGQLESRVREAATLLQTHRQATDSAAVNEGFPAQALLNVDSQDRRLARAETLLAAGRRVEALLQANWDLLQRMAPRFRDDTGYRNLVQEMWGERAAALAKWGWNDLTENGAESPRGQPYPTLERRLGWLNEASGTMLGIEFPAVRFPGFLALGTSGYSIGPLNWTFRERRLILEGDLIPPSGVASVSSDRTQVEGEPDVGSFAIRFGRERRGSRHLYFDRITLPPHLRGQGLGTRYFAELVRLSRQIGIDTIESPDTSGDHRYSMAVHGVRFKNNDELRRVRTPFDALLHSYIMRIPQLADIDTSAVQEIQTPRDIAWAHIDPSVNRLVIEPWRPGGQSGQGPAEIPNYYRVGRQFLLSDSPSYHGVFELKPVSYSMNALRDYLHRRFPKEEIFIGDEN